MEVAPFPSESEFLDLWVRHRFVADVVGLGKSFIGAAIVKHFEQSKKARPLIICPPPLIEMWERYNETYHLNARVLSLGMLKQDDDNTFRTLLENYRYKDRDFILIDESHHLRNHSTQLLSVGAPSIIKAIESRFCSDIYSSLPRIIKL